MVTPDFEDWLLKQEVRPEHTATVNEYLRYLEDELGIHGGSLEVAREIPEVEFVFLWRYKHINEIISYIKEKKSVSEMSRLLNVSRSSLKDYIESRELKQVAFGSLLPEAPQDAEAQVINTISCPNLNIK